MTPPELPASIRVHPLLGQWIRVREDGCFDIYSGKVELGQGISAALTQIACCTLGIEPAQVNLVAGDTHASPNEGYTAGSQSIEVGGAALRHACTVLRQRCAGVAASRAGGLQQPLRVASGRFSAAADGPHYSYLELSRAFDCAGQRLDFPLSADCIDATVMLANDGAVARADLSTKLGGGGYVHDLVLDGMLHARVLRGPHPHARLVRVDMAALRALPGVAMVVQQGEFLALVGADQAGVIAAVDASGSSISWSLPKLPPCGDTEAVLTGLPASTTVVHTAGAAAPASGVHRLRRRYSRPYIAHAAIGPACALAAPASALAGDPGETGGAVALTVWSHTQGSFQLRAELAAALALPLEAVRVVHTAGAGCYGHNGADDVAFDAAFLALKLNAPVRVQWTRADEMTISPMGPASLVELAAGLDEDGLITHWETRVWSHSHLTRPGATAGLHLFGAWACDPDRPQHAPTDVPLPTGGGLRNSIPYYTLPALQVQHHFVAEAPMRVSALRSLGAHANVFAIESFMDELAALAAADPVEFRLRHLDDARARHVVTTVARLAGWVDRPAGGEGHGFGVGFSRYKNKSGYLAVVVEVNVEAAVRVERVWAVVDVGAVVHRDGLLNQIEGGIVQALSWSLKEAVRWSAEGIVTAGWDDYPLIGFAELPEVVIEIVDRPDEPSLGAGELAPGPVSGALGNAVAHALGLRARHLPLSPDRLMALVQGDTAEAMAPAD